MFSFAVSIGSRLKNWKMKPMCSRRSFVSCVSFSSPISVSAIQTSPAVGWSSPARMCMSVDLPEPDGPITAVSSPLGDIDRDAAQGVHGRLVRAVLTGEVVGGHHGRSARRSCVSTGRSSTCAAPSVAGWPLVATSSRSL